MKRKIKSWIAAGMAAVMLSGCGTAAPEGNESTAGTGSTESTESTESTDSSAENGRAGDGGASEYPDYLNLDSQRPIVKDGEKITIRVLAQQPTNSHDDINDHWFVRFLEEKMNVDLEIEELSGEALGERKSLMFASDDLPDMMLNIGLSANDIMKYGVGDEQLLPMSDYVNETLTPNIVAALEGEEEAVAAATAPDGKMYTIPRFDPCYPGYGDTVGTQRCFIDTEYMQAAGIEKSPETLDEFIEMLRAFKKLDPAEFGVDEIFPYVATVGREREIIRNAFGWIGGDAVTPSWDAQKKDVVVACNDEKYGDFLRVMNTLYTEGLIHPDFLTMDVMTARALYAEGKVPVVADSAPYVSRPDHFQNYIALTPLSSQWCETGVTGQTMAYTVYGWHDVYISADTEHPELCMRLLDYLYSPEGSVYSTDGCPEGSEDSMGMIEGFTVDEKGNTKYLDVENGKVESYVAYSDGVISMGITGRMPRPLAEQEMCGIQNPQYPALEDMDMTNGDQNYRYQCYIAHQGHMVTPLPAMYMDEETSARYSDLATVIGNYVNEESAKFIVGQRSLEEIDAFFEELQASGIDEYEEIVRNAYAGFVEAHQ